MNPNPTLERASLPTEIHVAFERRVIVGTYTSRPDATQRAAARAKYGAVVRSYVAAPRHAALVELLREIQRGGASEATNRLIQVALNQDATFAWYSE